MSSRRTAPTINPAILPAHLRPLLKSYTRTTTLWSSFGSIYRLTLSSTPRSLILKYVAPPPSSRTDDESHIRKLISYRVERYFYAHLAARLPATVKVATHYPVPKEFGDTTLLLEDLSPEFPVSCRGGGAETVVKWIAGFHATFWGGVGEGVPPPMQVERPMETLGVWENGSYWYLATREEELESMRADREYDFLTPVAVEEVATYLADPTHPGRTLLHGDLKAANIVFSRDGQRCAVYDFQYCGHGIGAVDLVYFLATSVDGGVVRRKGGAERLVRVYYDELVKCLGECGKEVGVFSWERLLRDVEMAVVDWYRFQAGWSFWGNGWVSEEKVRAILDRVKKEKGSAL